MRHTISKTFLAALIAANLTLVPLPAPAQQPSGQAPSGKPTVVAAPAAPLPTERLNPPKPGVLHAESELVRIDVEVTDRSGKPIKGLRQDQFTVTDNGKPQPISSFSYSDIESIDIAGPENTTPVVIPVDGGRPSAKESVTNEVRDRRLIVLFFDMSSMETDDITRAHDAAEKFLAKQMTPADLVSVVVFSSQLSVLADFTNNRSVLEKAVAQILPGAATQLADNQYAAAQNGEYDVQQDTQAAYTPDQTEFNVFNTDQKLIAVEDITNVLAGIPGRKALVEFTGGITQTGEENRAELTAATDAANRADVSIYSIDARGMFATPPGGDVTTASATGASMFSGASVFHQTDQREDSRDTLATLSTDTGGRAFFDLGDLSDAFPKIQQDNGGYYLIGYNLPPDVKRDGRWRAVAVKVKAPGAHVRYRNGYYAPRDYQHLEKEDKEQQLEDALESPNPEVELPVAVETAVFRLSDTQVYVPISAKLSSSALEWAQKRGLHTAEFDFAAEVKGVPSGQTVAALRDTITVHLDEQKYQQVTRSNLVYQGGVVLSPGAYRLKFVARENESGKMGTFEDELVVPQRQPARMMMSSVMLSSQVVPLEKTEDVQTKTLGLRAKLTSTPLEMDGTKIIPSVTRYFTQPQTLYVFFQAYYPEKGGNQEAFDANTLRAGLVFFRGGVEINATPLLAPTALDPKTHTASFRISLPLAKLPTGRYTVQAIVIAAGTEQSAFGRAYLALAQAEPPPNPAAPPTPAPAPGAPAQSGQAPR